MLYLSSLFKKYAFLITSLFLCPVVTQASNSVQGEFLICSVILLLLQIHPTLRHLGCT